MRRAAETVEADRCSRPDARPLDRAIADYAGTEQRCGVLISDCRWQRVSKILPHDPPFGVTAIMIPSGEKCVRAKIFRAAPTISAGPAGFTQPRDPDPIAGIKTLAGRTPPLDYTYDFMAGHDTRMLRRQIAL